MYSVETVAAFLQQFAPAELAAEWDNVGLLVGDPRRTVQRVMTCLTVTPTSAAEAIERNAQLIVTHHPLPFRAVKRLTTETTVGRMLLDLIAARIAIYSPHTAFDSAQQGINQRLALGLGLCGIAPLVPGDNGLGTGRWGRLPEPRSLAELAHDLKQLLAIDRLAMVGAPERSIRDVAVACGAAGDLLQAAHAMHCDCMVIGETSFHTCLEAEATGIGLLLPGHFASERFALEYLAERLTQEFPDLEVWPSREERDPLRWL